MSQRQMQIARWAPQFSSSPSSLHRFVASSLICLLTGCAGGGTNAPKQQTPEKLQGSSLRLNQWLAQQPLDLPSSVYRVAPPDKIKVVAPGAKEIDGNEAVVRPDGVVGLNLVGELKVGGLTPGEISELIAQRLSKYYKADSIDVSVQVTEFKSQHFYVFGQVLEPGIKPYTGRDTIIKALADAQLNEKAWPQKIVIVRPNEDVNVHQRVTVDVKEMFENGKPTQNFLLEAGDLIYVPPSPLADVSDKFQKVITPIIPATQLGMIARGGI